MVDDGAVGLGCMMLPGRQWAIHDTWYSAGLRGTASHDIELEGAFVPEQHTFDLFSGTPCMSGPLFAAPLVQFALHIAALALGSAEGASDELTEFACTDETRLYRRTPMQDSELLQ
ncbi:MAG: hypothetical protein QF921_15845 [Pseudomonadales bacterium]|nr:hypothetical protein [Pseudomonadales bacterium]